MSYNKQLHDACDFINHDEIINALRYAGQRKDDEKIISDILRKATEMRGLDHREAAVLLLAKDPATRQRVSQLTEQIKLRFYGKRIILFAPLYLSNYRINGCVYCPYHAKNRTIPHHKLTQEQIRQEVITLQDIGHKRFVLEAGEDPRNNPIEYILELIQTICSIHHKNGVTRRVNANIAATTVGEYRMFHEADIGTYILFQETYHKERYEELHPRGPKSDCAYHTESTDRAMQGGIDDVGLGVLFGLSIYRYDFVGLMMHIEHLEATSGIGPHTINVPRVCLADDISLESFPGAIPDNTFLHIITVARSAVPYTGIIVSIREREAVRQRAFHVGVSQISGGSRTSVGGCAQTTEAAHSEQFEVSDPCTLDEVVYWLLQQEHIPSFCTVCYREGRTGDRFVSLCKSGQIFSCCGPNAFLTLQGYLEDYASPIIRELGLEMISQQLPTVPNERVRATAQQHLQQIRAGERDFRF